jgi:23S rRNA pseudouridine1911/1915/1917 synthase
MEATTYTVTVTADKAGWRLDRLLAESVPALSRVRWRLLIEGGHVDADGEGVVLAADRRVRAGETYSVLVPPVAPFLVIDAAPQPYPLDILYEDSHLIVLDKPAGLVVHPGAGNPDHTLVNALLAHCPGGLSSIGAPLRPGIVHRLDKDTSGLLVVAKTDRIHADLARQFADHSVERAYYALVWGVPVPASGSVRARIGRSPTNPTKMAAVTSGGKAAETRYRVLRPLAGIAALLECRPATGRTHQIRVHMASIGHPLIGDRTYGGGPRQASAYPVAVRDGAAHLGRQALHAFVIGFDHPETAERLRFSLDLPNDIKELIKILECV